MGDPGFYHNGMKISECLSMVENGEPYQAKRTWKERLFSIPWQPFKSSITVVPKVPRKDAVNIRGVWFMHPQAARALRQAIKVNREIR